MRNSVVLKYCDVLNHHEELCQTEQRAIVEYALSAFEYIYITTALLLFELIDLCLTRQTTRKYAVLLIGILFTAVPIFC